jgi:hypothetical protein
MHQASKEVALAQKVLVEEVEEDMAETGTRKRRWKRKRIIGRRGRGRGGDRKRKHGSNGDVEDRCCSPSRTCRAELQPKSKLKTLRLACEVK